MEHPTDSTSRRLPSRGGPRLGIELGKLWLTRHVTIQKSFVVAEPLMHTEGENGGMIDQAGYHYM